MKGIAAQVQKGFSTSIFWIKITSQIMNAKKPPNRNN